MRPLALSNISKTAILFMAAPWPKDGDNLLDEHTPFDPIAGQPMLLRAVEQLVSLGCQRLRVVLDDDAMTVRAMLQNGERWGCQISYHYSDPDARMHAVLTAIDISAGQHYYIANAWAVTGMADAEASRDSDELASINNGVAWHWNDQGITRWTGWGCLSGSWLQAQDIPLQPHLLAAKLAADNSVIHVDNPSALGAHTPASLLAGMAQMLQAQTPGIQCAPQAHVHPSARLVAPCRIGKAPASGKVP